MLAEKLMKEFGIIFFAFGFFLYSSEYYSYVFVLFVTVIVLRSFSVINKKISFDVDKLIDYCFPTLIAIGLTTIAIEIMSAIAFEFTAYDNSTAFIINLFVALIMVISIIFIKNVDLSAKLYNYNITSVVRNMFLGAVVYHSQYAESIILEFLNFSSADFKNIHILFFSLVMIVKITLYLLYLIKIEKEKKASFS